MSEIGNDPGIPAAETANTQRNCTGGHRGMLGQSTTDQSAAALVKAVPGLIPAALLTSSFAGDHSFTSDNSSQHNRTGRQRRQPRQRSKNKADCALPSPLISELAQPVDEKTPAVSLSLARDDLSKQLIGDAANITSNMRTVASNVASTATAHLVTGANKSLPAAASASAYATAVTMQRLVAATQAFERTAYRHRHPSPVSLVLASSQQPTSQQQMSHQHMSQQQMSHQQMSHQQMSHQQMSHQQMSHQQLSHQQLSHQQLSHQQSSQQQQQTNSARYMTAVTNPAPPPQPSLFPHGGAIDSQTVSILDLNKALLATNRPAAASQEAAYRHHSSPAGAGSVRSPPDRQHAVPMTLLLPAQQVPPPLHAAHFLAPSMDFRGICNQRYHFRPPRLHCTSAPALRQQSTWDSNAAAAMNHAYVAASTSAAAASQHWQPAGIISSQARMNHIQSLMQMQQQHMQSVHANHKGDNSDTSAMVPRHTAGKCADPSSSGGNAATKSDINLVHEVALRHSLPVNFEVLAEAGPPHLPTFVTRCTCGEFVTDGEGNSKKSSKKKAAARMLDKLKATLGLVPASTSPRPGSKIAATTAADGLEASGGGTIKKRRNRNNGKVAKSEGASDVANLACHVSLPMRSENEPLLGVSGAEGAIEAECSFTVGSTTHQEDEAPSAGQPVASGEACRKASVDMHPLSAASGDGGGCAAGRPPSAGPAKSALKITASSPASCGGGGDTVTVPFSSSSSVEKRVTFIDDRNGCTGSSSNGSARSGHSQRASSSIKHQLLPGVLVMQQHTVSGAPSVSHSLATSCSSSSSAACHSGAAAPLMPAVVAAIAQELLLNGSSATAMNIVKQNGRHLDCCESEQHVTIGPRQHLEYLANTVGLKVEYTNFPKGTNKNEYLTLVSTLMDQSYISHGVGATMDESHDAAALAALHRLSLFGQPSNDGDAFKKSSSRKTEVRDADSDKKIPVGEHCVCNGIKAEP